MPFFLCKNINLNFDLVIIDKIVEIFFPSKTIQASYFLKKKIKKNLILLIKFDLFNNKIFEKKLCEEIRL